MESTGLASYIAATRIMPDHDSPRIRSFDGTQELAVDETSSVQLRRALRYGDACQLRLRETPLAERIEAARIVVRSYEQRVGDASWALAHFRGLTSSDTRWMSQVNLQWTEQFEALVEVMCGGPMTHQVRGPDMRSAALQWTSKGKACLFSSSTMDGPPAVVALCHAMLSGTHLIFKPSFRDAATHLAFEALYEHDLHHYAQLVRWRSETPDAARLNRQLIGNVAQAVVFSANDTFRSLLESAAAGDEAERESLTMRAKRYGTGLPLAVVTARCDLDLAARDLVEGARLGGGRFCLSACPVLVERSCHDALVQRLAERAARLRQGPPLSETTELSAHDPASAEAMRGLVHAFGGHSAYGSIRSADMDLIVLADVPTSSSALSRELPGTALAAIPVDDMEQALAIANASLRHNQREAWTAVAVFGDDGDFSALRQHVPSYRYLRGGVVAQVKLLLPHQGSYFALDLMRRVTVE